MKEDKFKKFVNENREDFDLYSEDYDSLWTNIAEKVDHHQQKPRYRLSLFWKIAATFLVLLITTFFILKEKNKNAFANLGDESIPVELAEAALYYQGTINDKLAMINANRNEIDNDIFDDLDALDSAYIDLQKDLKDNADNQEVVEAMIRNYKIKLDMLEAILDELQQNDEEDKDNKRDQNEPVNI